MGKGIFKQLIIYQAKNKIIQNKKLKIYFHNEKRIRR
jgi:hypothetical protein